MIQVIGGLIGLASHARVLSILDSYFIGEILCGEDRPSDVCAGFAANELGTSLGNSRYNRSYTTGRIIQMGATFSRGDNLSLLASSGNPLSSMLLESDNTYFIRDNLVESATGLNFAGGPVNNASSTCYDNAGGATACPDLVVDALGSETMDNNALTSGPNAVCSGRPRRTGRRKSRHGRCLSLCRPAGVPVPAARVSPTARVPSLVGFDSAGAPLRGPGGGAVAQEDAEGMRCFNVADRPDRSTPP